jgi:NTE family protein
MKRIVLLVVWVGVLLGGISADEAFEPPPGPPREGVCLVLSGGGARGLAHIGVLEALDELGVRPACVVGTSAGALVGSLYCAGYSGREIEALIRDIDLKAMIRDQPDRRLLDFSGKSVPHVPSIRLESGPEGLQLPSGMLEGQEILKELNLAFTRRGVQDIHDFDRLPIPFRAVATDLKRGEAFVFDQGDLAVAVRASIAIPFFFTPVIYEDKVLVDGGVINNIAVDVARQLGYRTVIAVNVSAPVPYYKKKLDSLFQIMDESFALARLEKDRRLQDMADLVLFPDVSDYAVSDFHRVTDLVAQGYACAGLWQPDLAALFTPAPPPPASPPGWKYTAPVGVVSVEGVGGAGAAEVLAKSEVKSGGQLTEERLDRSVEKVYALNRYRSVDYRLDYDQGRLDLTYRVDERPRQALDLSLRFDTDYQFLGRARYTAREFLGSPLEAQLGILAGDLKDYRAAVELPVQGPLPLALRAEGYFTLQPREIRYDQELVDQVDEKHYGFAIGGTANLGNAVGVYGRLHLEQIHNVSLGVFDERERHAVSFVRVGVGVDTLNDWSFPTRGLRFDLHTDQGFRALGGDLAFAKLESSADLYLPLTTNNGLRLGGTAGWSRDLPKYMIFFAGGQNTLTAAPWPVPGYELNELYGKDLWTGNVEYRRRFPIQSLGLFDAAYLYLRYGVAGVRLPEVEADTVRLDTPYQYFHGGGIGAALGTRFGPVRVFLGFGQAGRISWTLSLGPEF